MTVLDHPNGTVSDYMTALDDLNGTVHNYMTTLDDLNGTVSDYMTALDNPRAEVRGSDLAEIHRAVESQHNAHEEVQ